MIYIELESPVTGVVWKVVAVPGSTIAAGDPVVFVECMKMEIPVEATTGGKVTKILVSEGDHISEDDPVAVIEIV
ncbi:MAG: acetyl-CoA carboxylase biotin carboxyl carrier protein subunit [Acidimicrobiales bacterium]|nr:acetyl-CoA carboxylase biotin carboxyl carrier protein subunit [Acidimicrobiales bacterium]